MSRGRERLTFHIDWHLMQLRPATVLGLLAFAATLCGCSLPMLQRAAPAQAPREIRDCRENMRLFGSFTVHATAVTWKRAPKGGTLSIALQFANDAQWELALSNSGNGILYKVAAELTDRQGRQFTPIETSGVLKTPDVNAAIQPGETKTGTLGFRVPRGSFTLRIERQTSGRPVGDLRGNLAAECTIG